MTTDDMTGELLLEFKRNLSSYYIHVFDPCFYLGFSNPSVPILRKKIALDETLGIYYSLVVTEVRMTISLDVNDTKALSFSWSAINWFWR